MKTKIFSFILFFFCLTVYGQDTISYWTEVKNFKLPNDSLRLRVEKMLEFYCNFSVVEIQDPNIYKDSVICVSLQKWQEYLETNQPICFRYSETNKIGSSLYWNGISIDEKTYNDCFFSFNGSTLRGRFNIMTKQFIIFNLDENFYGILEIPLPAKEGHDITIYPEPKNTNHSAPLKKNTEPKNIELIESGSVVIHLLVAYTPAAKALMPYLSYPTMIDFVFDAIKYLNSSFSLSNIYHQFELACVFEIPSFIESSSPEIDLDYFKTIPKVYNYRNKYSADICVLLEVSNDPNVPGAAFQFSGHGGDANWAYAVVDCQATLNQFSFFHEMGHLFGAQHDPSHGTNVYYAYGHGHCLPASKTIMALDPTGGPPLPRIYRYSNPDVIFTKPPPGYPTGICGISNNARVLSENAGVLGNYRISENYLRVHSEK